MDGIRDEAGASLGVELAECRREPDVPFGDEIRQADAVAAVRDRHRHDVPEVRPREPLASVFVVEVTNPHGELVLLFPRQRGDCPSASDVPSEARVVA